MHNLRMRFVMLLAASLLASAACTDQPDDGVGTASQSVVSNNRLSSNRLSSNRLSSNRLSSNRLSSNRLSSNRLQANLAGVGDLLATPEGQELLGYIISCALPDGQTLVAEDPNTGDPLEFVGSIGLAPKWIDKPLDKKGKRWVSACLFARVNANNVTVPISMRGPHHELGTTPEEVTEWSLQEAAFWGDYFRPVTEPIVWNACRGKDLATSNEGGLAERDCAKPDPARPGLTVCGFTDAGDCGDYAAPKSAHACSHFSVHGFWISCAAAGATDTPHGSSDDHDDGDCDHDDDDDGHGHGNDGHGAGHYHQVITTFVKTTI